jgi:hypothetical protein
MDDIGRTQARILAALWALEGAACAAWLEVQGEVHEAYKEMPFWILLAADMPPIEAHRHFWRVVEPELIHFGTYRVTVSYKAIADGSVLWHGFFDDLDGMRRALAPEGWDRPVRQDLAAAGIFQYSRRTPLPSGTKSSKSNKRRKRQ